MWCSTVLLWVENSWLFFLFRSSHGKSSCSKLAETLDWVEEKIVGWQRCIVDVFPCCRFGYSGVYVPDHLPTKCTSPYVVLTNKAWMQIDRRQCGCFISIIFLFVYLWVCSVQFHWTAQLRCSQIYLHGATVGVVVTIDAASCTEQIQNVSFYLNYFKNILILLKNYSLSF